MNVAFPAGVFCPVGLSNTDDPYASSLAQIAPPLFQEKLSEISPCLNTTFPPLKIKIAPAWCIPTLLLIFALSPSITRTLSLPSYSVVLDARSGAPCTTIAPVSALFPLMLALPPIDPSAPDVIIMAPAVSFLAQDLSNPEESYSPTALSRPIYSVLSTGFFLSAG